MNQLHVKRVSPNRNTQKTGLHVLMNYENFVTTGSQELSCISLSVH